MKENVNFAFAIGYVASLSAKLLNELEIAKIKKCETKNEFFNILKKNNSLYSENFKQFEKEIDDEFDETILNIKKVCPKTKYFEYYFSKNDFLNFKIAVKSMDESALLTFKYKKLANIPPEKLIDCVKTKNFENIPSPFKETFKECLEMALTIKSQKNIDIFLDCKMYELILKLAETEIFLKKRTQAEITLKNLNFCLRSLKNENNDISAKLIKNGLIEIEKLTYMLKKGKDYFLSILKEIKLESFKENFKEDLTLTDELIQQMLATYDETTNIKYFSYMPIHIYIHCLKRQNIFLKKKLINLTFGEII